MLFILEHFGACRFPENRPSSANIFIIISDFVFEPRKSGELVPPNSLRRNRNPHSARPSPFGSKIEIRDPSRRRAFRKPVEDAAQDRF